MLFWLIKEYFGCVAKCLTEFLFYPFHNSSVKYKTKNGLLSTILVPHFGFVLQLSASSKLLILLVKGWS